MFITGHRFSRNSSRGATENCLESDLAFQRARSLIRFTIIFQDRDTIIRIIDDTYSSFAAHATTKPCPTFSFNVTQCTSLLNAVENRNSSWGREREGESTFSCCRIRKRAITEYVWITYANHCNSCSLIISASISYSKPPANADRTLSLSRSPHFAPLYRSISIPPPSHLRPTSPTLPPRTRPFIRGVYKSHQQWQHQQRWSLPASTLQSYASGQCTSCRYRQ